MREIKYLVVHCSDTPNDREVTAEDVHRWHSDPKPKGNGWSGIGYNAFIRRDGTLEQGRPDYWQGAHVRDFDENGEGDNSDSLGICLAGRDQYTDAQLRTLEGWLLAKKASYPKAQVVGHCNLDSRKTCPNMDVPAWWASRQKKHID